MSFSFTMTDTQIEQGIPSIKKRAASIRADIHKVCVSILYRWNQSGDVRAASVRAASLLDAVDPSHAQKIVNWFSVYAGFEYQQEDKSFRYSDTTITEDRVKAAKAETAFDLTKDAEAKPFDLPGKIQNLLKQAKKAAEAGAEGSNVPEEMIEALARIIEA